MSVVPGKAHALPTSCPRRLVEPKDAGKGTVTTSRDGARVEEDGDSRSHAGKGEGLGYEDERANGREHCALRKQNRSRPPTHATWRRTREADDFPREHRGLGRVRAARATQHAVEQGHERGHRVHSSLRGATYPVTREVLCKNKRVLDRSQSRTLRGTAVSEQVET